MTTIATTSPALVRCCFIFASSWDGPDKTQFRPIHFHSCAVFYPQVQNGIPFIFRLTPQCTGWCPSSQCRVPFFPICTTHCTDFCTTQTWSDLNLQLFQVLHVLCLLCQAPYQVYTRYRFGPGFGIAGAFSRVVSCQATFVIEVRGIGIPV